MTKYHVNMKRNIDIRRASAIIAAAECCAISQPSNCIRSLQPRMRSSLHT